MLYEVITPLIAVSGVLFSINYFNIVSLNIWVSKGVLAVTNNPLLIGIPILMLVGLYRYNFKILKEKLYLDNSLQSKTQEVKTSELAWTRRFGVV